MYLFHIQNQYPMTKMHFFFLRFSKRTHRRLKAEEMKREAKNGGKNTKKKTKQEQPTLDGFLSEPVKEVNVVLSSDGIDENKAVANEIVRVVDLSKFKHEEKKADMKVVPKKSEITYNDLNEIQKRAVAIALSGESFFFTGKAGTGKTTCLRLIVRDLQGREKNVAVTASTGIAACQIDGSTVHSWAGVGLAQKPAKELAQMILFSKYKRNQWQHCHTLIIDEVSMLEPEFLDKLGEIAQIVRGNSLPFGGIQLILIGDFSQLPPVSRVSKAAGEMKYAFQSKTWQSCIKKHVVLTQIIRQKDEKFCRILDAVRVNKLTPQIVASIKKTTYNNLDNSLGIKPTVLFARNKDVDTLNKLCLQELPGGKAMSTFTAVDVGDQYHLTNLKKWSRYPEVLEVKEGAQVMLLQNVDISLGLCNGSRGIVRGFDDEKGHILVQFLSGQIVGIERHCITKFERKRNESGEMESVGVASRSQYPLKLAWAITIHKSQGMTCDLLEVDLTGCFEKGQAYTALSRASDINRLKVVGFQSSCVMCDPAVVAFERQLAVENGQDLSLFDETSSNSQSIVKNLSIIKNDPIVKDDPIDISFSGSAFVLTGDFCAGKSSLEEKIRNKGGLVRTGVSKKTKYVVAGSGVTPYGGGATKPVETSAKYQSAMKLNIPIISEKQLQMVL